MSKICSAVEGRRSIYLLILVANPATPVYKLDKLQI